MGDYQWEATSLEGFVQQVAVCYVGRGYFHYVTGWVPPKKDPASVDERLIGRYKPDITKWARARRKKAGTRLAIPTLQSSRSHWSDRLGTARLLPLNR